MKRTELCHRIIELIDKHKACLKVDYTSDLIGISNNVQKWTFNLDNLIVALITPSHKNRAMLVVENSKGNTCQHITALESEMLIRKIIEWYKHALKKSRVDEEKQILREAIDILENYKPE